LILLAYLMGSVPTGVLIGRFAGIDVRDVGSGNIGATNVSRAAGRMAGLVTLIADAGKGALAVALARAVGANPLVVPGAALAASLGHVFSVFLRFSGGKGVATALGSCLVLAPLSMMPPIAGFVVTLGATRIVSAASLTGVWLAPLSMLLFGEGVANVVVAALLAIVITLRHGENISRLRAGLEPRLGDRVPRDVPKR
jgi:glycerol-3-phosphate acyltransferase PlsY